MEGKISKNVLKDIISKFECSKLRKLINYLKEIISTGVNKVLKLKDNSKYSLLINSKNYFECLFCLNWPNKDKN